MPAYVPAFNYIATTTSRDFLLEDLSDSQTSELVCSSCGSSNISLMLGFQDLMPCRVCDGWVWAERGCERAIASAYIQSVFIRKAIHMEP